MARIVLYNEPSWVGKHNKIRRIGHCFRRAPYRQKEYFDYYFAEYCNFIGFNYHDNAYGIVKGNNEAGLKGLMKYDFKTPCYDLKAKKQAEMLLHATYAGLPRSRLVENYEQLFDLTTSSGYPWNLKFPDKKGFMKHRDTVDYMHRFVQATKYNLAIACNVVKTDEPKKQEKILNNDLRVICSLPVECTAMGNHLFGEMNENIYEAGRELSINSTVGLSKYYSDWERLYDKLSEFPNGIEFDFHKFDATVDEIQQQIIVDVRMGLFVAELVNSRTLAKVLTFYEHVLNTVIVLEDGDLMQKITGNPSGQTNTITDNGMANEFRWMYAFCKKCNEIGITPNYSFWSSNVRLAVQGDDVAGSISDQIKHWYNPTEIGKIFKEMDWVRKDESNQMQFKDVSQLEYCSLKFAHFGNRIVPVPSHPEKLICSMLRGSSYTSASFSVLRALALRADTYFHTGLFKLFDGYVQYMMKYYKYELVENQQVKYCELLANYKTVPQLIELYLGKRL